MADWKEHLYNNLLGSAQKWVKETFDHRVEFIESICRSPIEQALAGSLLANLEDLDPQGSGHFQASAGMDFDRAMGQLEIYAAQDQASFLSVTKVIIPQCKIGPYTADFLILARTRLYTGTHDLRVVVECDGHDFHERTKEQAAHDRSRDRKFQAAGFVVMRFTGSEIYANAEKCAGEVASLIERWSEDLTDRAEQEWLGAASPSAGEKG